MGPKYLVLYEWEGAHCLATLADQDMMIPEARAQLEKRHAYGLPLTRNVSWNVYEPIARHPALR